MQADPEMRTALHYAVAYKHQSIFAELLASGADLMAEVGSLSAEQLQETHKHIHSSAL